MINQRASYIWIMALGLWGLVISSKIYCGFKTNVLADLKAELYEKTQNFAFIKTNGELYKELARNGWTDNHDRFAAGTILDKLADGTLNSVGYSIHPPTIKDGHQIHKISVEATALTDREVFGFVDKSTKKFPGQLLPQKIVMHKHADIDEEIINQLEAGTSPDMISTEMSFDWVYMGNENEKNN